MEGPSVRKINSQTANFQIWLHEADGSISYHYGPNTLPPAATAFDGGYTGILVVKGDGSVLLDEINLEGKPGTPQIYRNLLTTGLPTLDTLPPNGTVYTFKRTPLSVSTISSAASFTFSPNPVQATLFIKGSVPEGTLAFIYNAAGQLVSKLPISLQNSIDVSKLTAGAYTIWLTTGTTKQHKFIKL